MSKKRKGYFSEKWKIVRKSFLLDKLIFKTFFYDLAFYLLVVWGFFIWGSQVKSKFASSGISNVGELMAGSAEQMALNYETLRELFFFYVGSIIIYIFIVAVIFGIFKGLIWGNLFKKKYNFKFVRKFTLVQLIYLMMGVWIFILLLINVSQILAGVFVLVWVHFGFLISFYLAKTNNLGKTFKKMFGEGFKFNKFVFPYFVIFSLLYLFNVLFNFVGSKTSNKYLNALLLLLLLLYFSIARNYVKNVCEEF